MLDSLEAYPALMAALVFLARVGDVSLGTLRTIMIFRGKRAVAAGIGFVEVLVWLCAVAAVLPHLDQWYLVLAYASGFATGNAVGMWIEGRLAIGHVLVRTISSNPDVDLAASLRAADFSVVRVPGRVDEAEENAEVLFLVERRRRMRDLVSLIDATDPHAVTTVSDVKEHRLMASTASGPRRFLWGRRSLRK